MCNVGPSTITTVPTDISCYTTIVSITFNGHGKFNIELSNGIKIFGLCAASIENLRLGTPYNFSIRYP